MSDKMEMLNDAVIAFVDSGSYAMTDFVHKTAQLYGVSKAQVRGLINNYDPNPGSPAGRPEKAPRKPVESFGGKGKANPKGKAKVAQRASEELEISDIENTGEGK